MDNVNNDWRTAAVRQNVVDRIAEAMQIGGVQQNANDMENQLFQKATSHEQYRQIVGKFLQALHDRNNQKKQMDPINALQNLTNQGARNPMPTGQMMNMGNNPNANVLQNLIHQRAAQGGQQQMAGMQNMRTNQAIPNAMGNVMPNVVGNVMQAGPMNANAMNINMGANIGQQGNAGGQMPNNMVGQIAQAMPMQGIRTNQGIGNAMPNSMPNANVMQQGNVMQQAGPMNANAMNSNNMNINMGNIAQQANANAQLPNSMAGQMQTLPNIQGIRNAQAMPNTMGNAMPNAGPNVMQQTNTTPGTLNPNINMAANIGQQTNTTGPANNMVGQMNPMNTMINQMNPMMRNQNAPNAMYQGIRNTTPNQPFFRKSPSPSAPSPMGGNLPNQMIPSPALVQMVPSPQVSNIMTQRNVMAQSPSNTNLNTPGQSGAAPSPLNPQEEHLYREKYRQLTKYIEPLKRMMARMGSDDEKLLKMNKLLEILCNPNQRIPLDTLMKCEVALEKMDLKSYSIASTTSTFGSGKEHNVNTLLFEAISANLQSPIGNHTLQRTFRPCIETLFGSDIKNLPPAKAPRMSSDNRSSSSSGDVSIVLQGEIARLDRKYRISIDPSNGIGSKVIKLICTLDDPFLPNIPPIYVSIPPDYPESSPKCTLLDHDFNATPFFTAIQKSFVTRMFKTATIYSLSHALDKLEMSVRHAYATIFDQDTPTVPMLELGA